jgi:hypothetical protein
MEGVGKPLNRLVKKVMKALTKPRWMTDFVGHRDAVAKCWNPLFSKLNP